MNIQQLSEKLKKNIAQVMVGSEENCELILMCALVQGHVLMEDVPGTGKTTLAKVFARSIDADFKRIQFTPDLLPSDLIGVNIYLQNEQCFSFKKGPLFSQIVLADEINRAAPRTQSSMLEAMEEFQISVDGITYPLPDPFLVIATQNPIESAGTFPLPEAQIDRFMVRLSMGYPSRRDEIRMLQDQSKENPFSAIKPIITAKEFIALKQQWQQVIISDALFDYLMNIVAATRNHEKITLGISPRAALAMVKCLKAYACIQGRDYVLPDDIKKLVKPVFAHRLVVYGASYARTSNTAEILDEIVDAMDVPTENFQGRQG